VALTAATPALLSEAASLEICAPPQFHLGYRPCLDGFRAVAILAVMGFHLTLPGMRGGSIGVDLFFVLSGFLITSLLLEEWRQTQSIDLKHFYIRRGLRLLPALLVLLCIIELYAGLLLNPAQATVARRDVLASLFYSANWLRALKGPQSMGELLSHTWSLSVEEQFYVLWPPLLFILLRSGIKRAHLAGLLAVLAAAVALRRAVMWEEMVPWHRIYNGLDTRFDSLLTGCAAAALASLGVLNNRQVRAILRFLCFPAGLFVGMAIVSRFSDAAFCRWGWPALEISCGIILLRIVGSGKSAVRRILELPVLVWIGRLSYSLYLWHAVVFSWAERLHVRWRWQCLGGLVVAFGCAAASFYLVETPFLKLKRRFQAA